MIRFEEYSSIRQDGSYCNIQQDFRNPKLADVQYAHAHKDIRTDGEGERPLSPHISRVKRPRRTRLDSLFLLATCQCNSRCRTCNFNARINEGRDLSFDEIRTVSLTAPAFRKLWISGGEPFLRKDLADVVELFYANNRIGQVHIWTNGILKDSIEVTVRRLTRNCPRLHVYLYFSLDGIGQTHDEIRGIPGNFQRVMSSIETLEKTYPSHPRVHLSATTVITSRSIAELPALGTMLLERFSLEDHRFDIARGVPRDSSLVFPDRGEVAAAHESLMQYHEAIAERRFGPFPPMVRFIARALYLGRKRLIYSLQRENMTGRSPWGMKCIAGARTVVVEHDGAFKACETRKPVGSLRDYGFDLGAALDSEAMKKEVDGIGYGKSACCWCTHPCWIDSSLGFNFPAAMVAIPCHYAVHAAKKYFPVKSLRDSIVVPKKASLLPLRK